MTDNKRWTPSDAKSPHCLWQGELKRILKCEYLHAMYSINMLHYISISKFLREIMASYLSFNSLMQQKQELSGVAMFVNGSGWNEQNL
jgi:superoxide dismutase